MTARLAITKPCCFLDYHQVCAGQLPNRQIIPHDCCSNSKQAKAQTHPSQHMLGLAALIQPWNKKQAFQIRISDRGPRVPSPRGGGRNFACALSTENWVHVDRSQDAVLSVGQSESGWTREGRRDDKTAMRGCPCVVFSDELRTRCQAMAAKTCDGTTIRARARFHDLRLWRGGSSRDHVSSCAKGS